MTGRLRTIALLLPGQTDGAHGWLDTLSLLLLRGPGCRREADGVLLSPREPNGALPVTRVALADVRHPRVRFDTVAGACAEVDLVRHANPRTGTDMERDDGRLLSIDEAFRVLQEHVTRVDHLGVNLPSAMGRRAWESLIRALSAAAALYQYPTGEEWPFVLPCTDEELATDISAFPLGREPKFELVYDRYTEHPVVQICFGTDLDRDEAAALFPEPYGVALPGLGEFSRTLYVDHPWPDLSIRLDLNYGEGGGNVAWDTGEWLVQEGGRIRQGTP